jgi:hemolysin III
LIAVKNARAASGEDASMRPKPILRGVIHELAFSAAVSAGVLLVATARSGEAKLGCGLYAVSLAGLFGISALYHRPMWPERVRAWLRRFDHAAIFLLIAGTYTPLALTLPSPLARQMLVVAWAGAALGVVRAIFFPRARRWVVALLALALGWASAAFLPEVHAVAGHTVTLLLALGGGLYSLGALAYALRRPDPWPRVFGYHEIFHALVVLAAICHFAAIAAALPVLTV